MNPLTKKIIAFIIALLIVIICVMQGWVPALEVTIFFYIVWLVVNAFVP